MYPDNNRIHVSPFYSQDAEVLKIWVRCQGHRDSKLVVPKSVLLTTAFGRKTLWGNKKSGLSSLLGTGGIISSQGQSRQGVVVIKDLEGKGGFQQTKMKCGRRTGMS